MNVEFETLNPKTENSYESNKESDYVKKSKPGYISQLFSSDKRYGRRPKVTIRRRGEIFIDCCQLCEVDTSDPTGMFPLMQTAFLRGTVLVYFMDVGKKSASSTSMAVGILKSHFLVERAKRVNDEVWFELLFDFMKSKRLIHNKDVNYDVVPNDC